MGSDGAQAVKALTQAAQPAAQAAQAGQAQGITMEGLLGNVQDRMQPNPQIATDIDIGMLTAKDFAMQAQQQRAQEMGGPAGLDAFWNDLINNGASYIDEANRQQNAVNTMDIDAIRDYQSSGDPLLDVIKNWDYYNPYEPS